MPFAWQAFASSDSISRDASEMSVSPAQNFSKPPPVPEVPTVTLTFGFSPLNSSAIASVSGPTVLDPSMRISPERFAGVLLPPSPLSSLLPQAATPIARTPEAARTSHHLLDIQMLLFRLQDGDPPHSATQGSSPDSRGSLSVGLADLVTWVWPGCKKDVNADVSLPGVSQAWGENR